MLGTFDRKKNKFSGFQPNWGDFFGKGAIVLAILAGTMSLTNPDREEYLNYASGRLAQEARENWCKESNVPDILSGLSKSLVNACQSLVTTQRGSIKKYIDNATQRQNAVLFSIYTTELIDRRYQTIGVFGNFLTFSSEKVEGKSGENPIPESLNQLL